MNLEGLFILAAIATMLSKKAGVCVGRTAQPVGEDTSHCERDLNRPNPASTEFGEILKHIGSIVRCETPSLASMRELGRLLNRFLSFFTYVLTDGTDRDSCDGGTEGQKRSLGNSRYQMSARQQASSFLRAAKLEGYGWNLSSTRRSSSSIAKFSTEMFFF